MTYTLGILGGSGLYEIDDLEDVRTLAIETPYGAPSDVLTQGTLAGVRLVFLPRHGRGHRMPPHKIDFRANICALKKAGSTHLLSVSAVGSMKEEIAPGDFVVVDQYIDLTRKRTSTFFEDGIAAHVAFGDPVCEHLSRGLASAAKEAGARVHEKGTYVCIDGPQFSTRAESLLYRSWGVSVIGMTAMPEAKLAREAELPFATLALATDYDCWHESEEEVSVEAVVLVMKKNVALAKKTIALLAARLPDPKKSRATGALRGAVMTDPAKIPSETRQKLSWLMP